MTIHSPIHVLANAISSTGAQAEVNTGYRGIRTSATGVLYIDFNGTSFTAALEARVGASDTWVTLGTITEASDPVQEIVLPKRLRLNVSAFTGTSLTVKVSE